MARRLDDRAGLATRADARLLVARHDARSRRSSRCSPRPRSIGEELGNTEIRAEAMAWRVPAFVALCDLDVGAARGRRAAARRPSRRRSRSCSTSPSTTARRSRSATAASTRPRRAARRSHEWSRLLTGRDAVGRLRDPDVQRPPRAGAPGGARAGDPDPRRRRRRARAVAAGARLAARRARHGGGGAARARAASRPTGSTRFRESLWLASLTYLTDACAALGDEDDGGARLPGARAARRGERDDRPPRRLLRRGRPLPGHARRDARRVGARRGALRARAWSSNRRMGAVTWLAHTAYEYARLLLARGAAASATGPRRCSARRRRSPSASACRALLGRIRALGSPAARRRRLPDGLSPREVADPRPRRPAASATARSAARCRSASTRPPTTCAASCARPAARTAPRPPPTPTGTGSPRSTRRHPVRSAGHAALRDRAQLRRAARPHERRRRADRRDQRRRGRPLAVLVPQRRPAADLLPLRGAVAGRDHRRRPAGERPGRRGRRGRRRPRRSCRAGCATGRRPCPRPSHQDPGIASRAIARHAGRRCAGSVCSQRCWSPSPGAAATPIPPPTSRRRPRPPPPPRRRLESAVDRRCGETGVPCAGDPDPHRRRGDEPGHPIAAGLGPYFEIPREEMYGERFDIPAPDTLVFLSWFQGGEVFRSGCCYQRGLGKIFYFRPGHETCPTYYQKEVLQVIANGVRWAVHVLRRHAGHGVDLRRHVVMRRVNRSSWSRGRSCVASTFSSDQPKPLTMIGRCLRPVAMSARRTMIATPPSLIRQ